MIAGPPAHPVDADPARSDIPVMRTRRSGAAGRRTGTASRSDPRLRMDLQTASMISSGSPCILNAPDLTVDRFGTTIATLTSADTAGRSSPDSETPPNEHAATLVFGLRTQSPRGGRAGHGTGPGCRPALSRRGSRTRARGVARPLRLSSPGPQLPGARRGIRESDMRTEGVGRIAPNGRHVVVESVATRDGGTREYGSFPGAGWCAVSPARRAAGKRHSG